MVSAGTITQQFNKLLAEDDHRNQLIVTRAIRTKVNAYTISTGNVLNNGGSFDKYLIAVESAIQHLQKINDESG